MRKDKKGQTGGLVTGLVFGIASLIIAIIIAMVIVTTVGGSSILEKEAVTITNESQTSSGLLAHANLTDYTVVEAAAGYSGAGSFVATVVYAEYWTSNGSCADTACSETQGPYNITLASANYTFSSAGVLSNTSTGLVYGFPNVSISYTYTKDSTEIKTANWATGNFSGGINNVSSKLPTALLIAAIVLILGILAVLVTVWNRMRGIGSSI